MPPEVRFIWTKDLGRSAQRVVRMVSTGRLWLFLLAGVMVLPLGLLDYYWNRENRSILFAFVGLFMLAVYTFRTLADRRHLRDTFRSFGEQPVTLSFDEQLLAIAEGENRSVITWDRVTHSRRLGGFLLVYSHSILWAIIPEEFLSAEQIDQMQKLASGPEKS